MALTATTRFGPELRLATRRGKYDFWMYGAIDLRKGKMTQNIYHLRLLTDRNSATCSCPDYEYRKGPVNGVCKHGESLLASWRRG